MSAPENKDWFALWREAVERVIATTSARDRTREGTPERAAAEKEQQIAVAAYRKIAGQIQ